MNDAEKKLVKALRSEKYIQTRLQLRRSDGFCCLGVACDIFGKGRWNQFDEFIIDSLYEDQESRFVDVDLPPHVQKELNWSSRVGNLKDIVTSRDGIFQTLSALNDQGFTFDQIADIIEAGLVLHYKGE